MKRMTINGNNALSGTINISGAKNSAVALIPAAILCDEEVIINNVPNISDIDALIEILEYLNAKVEKKGNTLIINASNIDNKEIPEEISKKLRASYYFMSTILGKYKDVKMFFPGGCKIGSRPIDQTLKAFKSIGATINELDNKYHIYADNLIGSIIHLDMPSVGATINAIFSSVKAKGTTIIYNAAKEPEITNVIEFLNNMGADISSNISGTVIINGVNYLHKAEINVIPDRIEAGTYMIIGALLGNNLKINNVIKEHLISLLDTFDKMNVNYTLDNNSIILNKSNNLLPVNVETKGYPGFATDLQQPLTPLLTYADGTSYLTENLYENRFNNIPYLNEMGANIVINNRTLTINGKTDLIGKHVYATDLRAGACMVIAGLVADGITIIDDIEFVLRGYEDIINKLNNVGAKIVLEEI